MASVGGEHALVTWVVTYALHSSALLGSAWATARLCGRRHLRLQELVWKTALVGAILTATAQVALDVAPAGGRLDLRPASEVAAATRATAPAGEGGERAAERSSAGSARAPAIDPRTFLGGLLTSPHAPSWRRLLVGAWALIGLAGVALLGLAWSRVADHIAGRRVLRAGPLHDLLLRLARRAGVRAPRLTTSRRLRSPATVGVFFPQICVPRRALGDLCAQDQEAMLAHELAHVARRDPLWFFACRLIERALFFQPLNRVARRELREAAEYLADDFAVQHTGRGLCLARCLAEVAGWMIAPAPPLGVLPMAARGSQLGRRIRRLLDDAHRPERHRRRPWSAPLAGGLLCGATLVLPGAGAPAAAGTGTGAGAARPWPAAASEAAEEREDGRRGAPPDERIAVELRALLDVLDEHVELLRSEIESLTRALAESDLEAELSPLLSRLNERARELRDRQGRVREELRAALARPTPDDTEEDMP